MSICSLSLTVHLSFFSLFCFLHFFGSLTALGYFRRSSMSGQFCVALSKFYHSFTQHSYKTIQKQQHQQQPQKLVQNTCSLSVQCLFSSLTMFFFLFFLTNPVNEKTSQTHILFFFHTCPTIF